MRPLAKNMVRELSRSRGRFIAIILITLLGVMTFVGIKGAGPTLERSLDTTTDAAKLADIQAISTAGWTNKDQQAAASVAGAQVMLTKFKYVLGGNNRVVALYGLNAKPANNHWQLRSGRLPRAKDEVLLDQRAKTHEDYRIGDHFRFDKSAGLARRTYKVVGFADSPQYIDNALRGSADIGDGTVRYFAVVQPAELNMPLASLMTIRFPKLTQLDATSKAYEKQVAKQLRQVKAKLNARKATRKSELRAPIDQQQQQLNQAKQQVVAQSGGQLTTTPELTAAQVKLDAAAQQLPKVSYMWQTRKDLPGYSAYTDSAQRITAIANVFPVFFFLIAALITFTTITRMIEEARVQIGTFRALGYGKWAIARNYLLYAFAAATFGTLLGALIGNTALPRIILALYTMYIPLTHTVPIMWGQISIAFGLALLSSVGAAIIVISQQLKEKPAELMRPRAPKSAKRILLERITPLWRRLSFHRKVSYRNLFRYKSRMLMTIIGIAGGTALIMTGFGLQQSITSTASRQYGDVFHYDALVRLRGPKADQAVAVLEGAKAYRSRQALHSAIAKVSAKGHQLNDVNLFTTDNADFSPSISLQTAKGKRLTTPKSGMVIAQKLADILKVQPGDALKVTLTSGETASVKIAAVTENYVGHFAYMNQDTFAKQFKVNAGDNTWLLRLHPASDDAKDKLASDLLATGQVLGTSYTSTQTETIESMSQTLIPVVLIFILLSGLLSFVVLYNLTNISISERIRELSTIKVLGFFDREVTMYIVRENIVMTIVGILVGYGLGNLLTWFILHQAATELVIFPMTIRFSGYAWATGLMVLFTAVVMGITHLRLRRIDMIEALKANE